MSHRVADSPSIEGSPRQQVDFSKAQGSSRNDEADLRDVARKAAKKSQVSRQADDAPSKKDRQMTNYAAKPSIPALAMALQEAQELRLEKIRFYRPATSPSRSPIGN